MSRSAELRKLFPSDRLTALVSSGEPIEWVVGDITQDRTVTLYAYFRQILGMEEVSARMLFVTSLRSSSYAKAMIGWAVFLYSWKAGALWRNPDGQATHQGQFEPFRSSVWRMDRTFNLSVRMVLRLPTFLPLSRRAEFLM